MVEPDGLAARLRRLRRDEPRREPRQEARAAAPERAPLPDHLVRRLARAAAAAPSPVRTTHGPPVGLEREGPVLARRERFALDARHGSVALGDVLAADAAVVARVAKDEGLVAFDPRAAVFLDIEATGLSGGSGTYPFLVALGGFVASGAGLEFELWQGFMPSPSDEAPLLEHVARRIGSAAAIVSFFGKCYDRHRLEDKMRHHRIAPPFVGRAHLDLFHPLSRLYRGAFESGRLAVFERELCGVERMDDLGGAHAPAAWFDFVAGRPHRLEEVFRHNRADVLSLVTLCAHLGAAERARDAAGGPLPGPVLPRCLGLARAASDAGAHAEAARAYECALALRAPHLPPDADDVAWARALERCGDGERAAALLGRVLAGALDDRLAAEAGERCARLLVRSGADEAARRALGEALERARRAHGTAAAALVQRLTARLART
jgi:uncharacterized protein YprB with RNaseH-like and TPR domain